MNPRKQTSEIGKSPGFALDDPIPMKSESLGPGHGYT